MFGRRIIILCFSLLTLSARADRPNDPTALAVWTNEAIVATYTYNAQNFMERQKEIAFYFTAAGWIAYSKALNDAKIPDMVKKNAYSVNAVATMPPQIKSLHPNYWQATMPLLVVYKNPQYLQQQTLEITLEFTTAAPGQGIRGLAITSLQSKIVTPPCQCTAEAHPTTTTTQ